MSSRLRSAVRRSRRSIESSFPTYVPAFVEREETSGVREHERRLQPDALTCRRWSRRRRADHERCRGEDDGGGVTVPLFHTITSPAAFTRSRKRSFISRERRA